MLVGVQRDVLARVIVVAQEPDVLERDARGKRRAPRRRGARRARPRWGNRDDREAGFRTSRAGYHLAPGPPGRSLTPAAKASREARRVGQRNDLDRPGVRRACGLQEPWLDGPDRERHRGADTSRGGIARVAVESGRKVDRGDRRTRAVERIDPRDRFRPQRERDAGAEERVDHEGAFVAKRLFERWEASERGHDAERAEPLELRRGGARRRGRLHPEHLDGAPGRDGVARDHEAVAAVVARARHDDHAARSLRPGRAREGTARPGDLHQVDRSKAQLALESQVQRARLARARDDPLGGHGARSHEDRARA